MGLKLVPLKKTYSSDFDDILKDFYIPALSSAIEYCRLAGFFSSTSLAIAARGIKGLIDNHGIMKMIVCPKLTKDDVKAITDAKENPEKYLEGKMSEELFRLDDGFIRDHVLALGWMVANGNLEIKVAIVCDEKNSPLSHDDIEASGIFHQKVGILKDKEGNIVTFSGSVNETASGWLGNIEEFKVFRSWIPSEEDYAYADLEKFNRFWNDFAPRIKTFEIPLAVRKGLIEMAPKNIEDIHLERWYERTVKKAFKLRPYQENAIRAWLNNNGRGIFEMATGTGKTLTALGCADRIFQKKSKSLVIITCPFQHLVSQWIDEIRNYGLDCDHLIEAHGGTQWKDTLSDSLADLYLGNILRAIVVTTHDTFSSGDFIHIIQNNLGNIPTLLIADEVHGLGAPKLRNGLIEEYKYRLGLSATPKRWFDDSGTQKLYCFFGDTVFEFSLMDAVTKIDPSTGRTFLTPFKYIPEFVSLTEEEREEYFQKNKKIIMRYYQSKNEERDEVLERLLFSRANIVKNAVEKYKILERILDQINTHTIIYCTPQQIKKVMEIVRKKGFICHSFTMKESATPAKKYGGVSERSLILTNFQEGKYQVLIAMRCLDEGVDIPPAKTAILMASSGNPREYIQRIGRVIRRHPDKPEAIIFDIIVVPSLNANLPPEIANLERSIFSKELKRYEYIAKIAINRGEALNKIQNIKNKLRGF